MLTFDNVTITQGQFSLTADCAIPSGITAILGASGCGKSTLLAAIAGFLPPHDGSIIWNDIQLNALPPAKRPIAMLFQDNNLFPHLTIVQNVGLGIKPAVRLSGPEIDRIENALAQVGLAGFEHRKPGTLSGGQQSRAALARVLVSNRPLILLDEPFAALGPQLKQDMLDLVRDHLKSAGKTILMVTHNPEDAQRVADNIVLVGNGLVHAPQNTQKTFDDPPPLLQSYLGT